MAKGRRAEEQKSRSAEELARKAAAKDHTGGQKAQRRHKWGLPPQTWLCFC